MQQLASLAPTLRGVGLGLRREIMADWIARPDAPIDFIEIAPENWMNLGGRSAKVLQPFAERYPMVCHGLSLSLGGTTPLDFGFLKQLKSFFSQYKVALYTEHLSFCSDAAHAYDLLPVPFTDEMVHYIARRIRQVQDFLGRRIAIENTSYYLQSPLNQMDELTFVNAVLQEADCDLQLDVNNVFVNSVNHGFDAAAYIHGLPQNSVVYMHIAGHYQMEKNLIIDTHGADVIEPVWALLDLAYRRFGVQPTLLERDFNLPAFSTLLHEIEKIHTYQQHHLVVKGG